MAKKERKGLGRGLSALMADIDGPEVATEDKAASAAGAILVPIEKVLKNPQQPRFDFDKEKLAELAASIKARGIIQPLIVRPVEGSDDEYQIVAGERRWKAAQLAQLHDIPVIIREMDEQEFMEIAIIENIQRDDLNPIEEARGYQSLMKTYGNTQEQVSEALGKSRSHIANLLRLLKLPMIVQGYLRTGKLTAGHVRTLVGNEDAEALAKVMIEKGLSVRAAEALVKQGVSKTPMAARPKGKKDADTKALESDLKANLKMKVSIDHDPSGKGKLTVNYKSLDDLDRLIAALSKSGV
ncbi:MAG: ParB/RepB/Spo0J family partition protein [Pseudomonadota bacterium]